MTHRELCPICGNELRPEHAHDKCDVCGYLTHCCAGECAQPDTHTKITKARTMQMKRPAILYINSKTIGFESVKPTLAGVHTIIDLRDTSPDWQAPRVYKIKIPGGCPVPHFFEREKTLWGVKEVTDIILELRDSLLFNPDDPICFVCDCGNKRCTFHCMYDLISLHDNTPNHRAFKRFVPFTIAPFSEVADNAGH